MSTESQRQHDKEAYTQHRSLLERRLGLMPATTTTCTITATMAMITRLRWSLVKNGALHLGFDGVVGVGVWRGSSLAYRGDDTGAELMQGTSIGVRD
jgi:hypothetical protein